MRLVAQVGCHKRRTDGDIGRWLTAVDWLLKNKVPISRLNHDVVNLDYGRDFLREDKRYHMVVMHDIYDGKVALEQQIGYFTRAARKVLQTSPLQSPEAWVQRLAATQAEYIFVFEMQISCLNGWKLGDIPGYITAHRDTEYTVYRKEKA